MKINLYTNNSLQLQGRVASINEYSKGKAANISLAIDNGKDKSGSQRETSYVQLKSFTPATYNQLHKGMKIQIYGHVTASKYEKNGQQIYTTDLIADYVDFLESKFVVDNREALRAEYTD